MEDIEKLKEEIENNKDKADLFKASYKAYKDMYTDMQYLYTELKEEELEFYKNRSYIYKQYYEAYKDLHGKMISLLEELDDKYKDSGDLESFLTNVHIPIRKIFREVDSNVQAVDLKLIDIVFKSNENNEAAKEKLCSFAEKLGRLHNTIKDNSDEFDQDEFDQIVKEYTELINNHNNQTEE